MRHRILIHLCLLMLLPTGAAATPQTTLQQLHLSLEASLGDFYLLYGVDPDPRHGNSLTQHLARGDRQLQQLSPLDTPEQLALRQAWDDYRHLLDELSTRLQQGQDLQGSAIASLIERKRRVQGLCQQLAADPLAPGQPLQLALQLQSLASDYIAHSIGANALGGAGSTPDEQSRAFAEALRQLQHQRADKPEQRQRLQAIARKWRYIEPALLNYRHATVPSLVQRYTTAMVAELGQLQDPDPVP